MTTIVTRAGKGSPLTNTEMDTNLTNLNTYKCETANNLSDLTNATTARSNLGLVIGTNVPSPTGTGASGTWGINVTGSAGSATTATQVSNSHTAGTGLSGSTFNGSTAVTWTLATSGVSAGSYGSASAIPVITVDAYGRATNITTATVAGGQSGIAKAWVNFQGGNGNTAGTINASFNVSSITVNAAGDYTANFTTAMPDANYVVSGSSRYGDNAAGQRWLAIYSNTTLTNSMNASYVRCVSAYQNGGFDAAQIFTLVVHR